MDSFVSSFSGICKYTECSDTYLPRNAPAIVKIIWIRNRIQHSPVMDWQPVRDAYCLSSCACWERLQSLCTFELDKQTKMNGCMNWWYKSQKHLKHLNSRAFRWCNPSIYLRCSSPHSSYIPPQALGDIAEFPSWDRVTISWVWFNVSSLFEMPRTPHLRGCPKH